MGKAGAAWVVGGLLLLGWISGGGEKARHTEQPPANLQQPAPLYSTPETPFQPAQPRGAPAEEVAFTSTRVNAREAADPRPGIVTPVPAGTRVVVVRQEGGWSRVAIAGQLGWISSNYLRERSSAPPAPAITAPKVAPPPLAIPPRATPAPSRSGEQYREPYVGTCDCPYDRMRNGRRCGGNSAYSKPGGRSPKCYF